MIENILLGLTVALTFKNILYCFAGILLGTAVGVLPGLGSAATIAILLPFTYGLGDTTATLILLAGIFYGSQYGGSTTAILVNLPGESASAITAIDGYQMARNGRAGAALTIAALSSFFAGTVSVLIMAAISVPLSEFAVEFNSADYASLMLLGIVAASALSNGSFIKGLGMSLLGLLISTMGTDINTGLSRFTFGVPEFLDGIPILIMLLGLFGMVEFVYSLLHHGGGSKDYTRVKFRDLMPTREEFKRAIPATFRGTAIGSFFGLLPGGGSTIGSIASYVVEKRVSKHPEQFGKGAIEGVAGPESANNAGAQTSFIPLLSLGLPIHPIMALLAAVMFMQNISPGPMLMTNHPTLFWGLIMSFWVGNLMLVILNLPLVHIWVKLLILPNWLLYPAILFFVVLGAWSVNHNWFDVWMLIPITTIGYVFKRCGCEPAPLIMGFILGKIFEENLRRALVVSHGDYMTFIDNRISLCFLIVTVLLIFATVIKKYRLMT